ncbi:MAG: hypothetical protein JW751_19810 [Polyangiaceae bacterium]|nr:hypothetical protein [Polyangiaceae bacterium]
MFVGPGARRFLGWPTAATAAALMVACVGRPWQPKEAKGSRKDDADFGRHEGEFNHDLGEAGTPTPVAVDLERRYQTLDGFGAATAWYHDRIVGKTPDGLYELLFPELGLDILRFRNRYDRGEKDDRNIEVETEILERATKALGHPPKLLLSSWSPPAALKANGAERCKSNPDCTLIKKKGKFVYDEFADYWLESLRDYEKRGIFPDFISIQNEPDFSPPDWEGCRFTPAESPEYPGYDRALAAVHGKVQQLAKPPALVGPETIGVHYDKVENYLAKLDQNLLYAVAHHLYEMGGDGVWDWRSPGPDSYRDEMEAVGLMTNMRRWQTEFATDEDKGIEGGFETAALIEHLLVAESGSAFVYWNLVWDGAGGLVGMMGRRPRVRDQYYAMRHFSRFTDPGWVRVNAWTPDPALRASGWISPDDQALTVVLLNTGEKMLDVEVDLGGFAASKVETRRTTFRPSESERWRDLGDAGRNGVVRLPSRSIATIALTK